MRESSTAVFLSYASPAFALALRRGKQDAEAVRLRPEATARQAREDHR